MVSDTEGIRFINESEVEHAVVVDCALVVFPGVVGLGKKEAYGVNLGIPWIIGGVILEEGLGRGCKVVVFPFMVANKNPVGSLVATGGSRGEFGDLFVELKNVYFFAEGIVGFGSHDEALELGFFG